MSEQRLLLLSLCRDVLRTHSCIAAPSLIFRRVPGRRLPTRNVPAVPKSGHDKQNPCLER
jgi:hypothetical protein